VTRDEPPQIPRERAKQLIDEHQWGCLIVSDLEPVPTIGDVDEDDQEYWSETATFQFGELGDGDEGGEA
jgi:hypothetical protein